YASARKVDAALAEERNQIAKLAEDRNQIAIVRGDVSAVLDNLANTLAILGVSLLQSKNYSDAESALSICVGIREKNWPDRWNTFNAKAMLGAAQAGQKRYAEAEPQLLKGYEGLKARANQIPQQRRSRVTETGEELVKLYEAWGKPEAAAQWRKELDA